MHSVKRSGCGEKIPDAQVKRVFGSINNRQDFNSRLKSKQNYNIVRPCGVELVNNIGNRQYR